MPATKLGRGSLRRAAIPGLSLEPHYVRMYSDISQE
jgi:hypothetical protein